MSDVLVITLADAVVAEINASPLGLAAVRHYRPQFDLAELKTLRCSVVPRGIVISALNRKANQNDLNVDVAVQKKLVTADNDEIDPLMLKVQELIDLLRMKRLTTLPSAAWIKAQNNPIYALEHMDQQRVFTSLISLTYRMSGEVT